MAAGKKLIEGMTWAEMADCLLGDACEILPGAEFHDDLGSVVVPSSVHVAAGDDESNSSRDGSYDRRREPKGGREPMRSGRVARVAAFADWATKVTEEIRVDASRALPQPPLRVRRRHSACSARCCSSNPRADSTRADTTIARASVAEPRASRRS